MANKTIVTLNWLDAEDTPGSAKAIARGCTCYRGLTADPVPVAKPDCPLHGLQRLADALRSGEAELVGDPVEVDLSTLGSVAGGRRWSAGDIADLIFCAREGRSDAQVAAGQGRGLREVRAKAAELGLTLRSGAN